MNGYRILIPLGLGLVAALANFLAVRSKTAAIEIVAVTRDVKAGHELTDADLVAVAVRADSAIEVSAVRYDRRGELLGRKVNRALRAREVLFATDTVRRVGDDVQTNLRPGEVTRTLLVKAGCVAPNLQVGDQVGLLLRGGALSTGGSDLRLVGPYRLVGVSEKDVQEQRTVVLALPVTAGQLGPDARPLDQLGRGYDGRSDNVAAVEYYRVGR
jgi:hypothetical protein